MKKQDERRKYIELRAEGNSYKKIAEQLHISTATCHSWEKELEEQIEEQKREKLKELAESYGVAKEARIKRLGETLNRINTAVDQIDYSTISAEKLLALQLQYTDALKTEYSTLNKTLKIDELTPSTILASLTDLLNRVRAGELTAEQANKESTVIANILKAYEDIEIRAKVEELERLIENEKD